MVIYLVGCTKSKSPGRLPARDKYMASAWYRAARKLAEAKADRWYILSARYGLLWLADKVKDYNETMAGKTKEERRVWAHRVLVNLVTAGLPPEGSTYVILAGKLYRHPGFVDWLKASGYDVQEPLEHIQGIGNQIKWMQESVSQG